MSFLPSLFQFIGAIVILYILYNAAVFIYLTTTARRHNNTLTGFTGDYAVITGASNGIGLAYAYALARRNINCILIGRNEQRLHVVKKQLEQAFPHLEFIYVVFDCTTSELNRWESLLSVLQRLKRGTYNHQAQILRNQPRNITLLINNVGGFGLPSAEQQQLSGIELMSASMWEQSVGDLLRTTTINVWPTLILTHALLQDMRRLNRGVIVNISSVASLFATPALTAYSSSKAFINQMSEVVNCELSGEWLSGQHKSMSALFQSVLSTPRSIHVECHLPAQVQSNTNRLPTSLLVPTSEQFAEWSCSMVGVVSRFRLPCAVLEPFVCCPYPAHALMVAMLKLLPVKVRHVLLGSMIWWQRRGLKRLQLSRKTSIESRTKQR